MDDEEKFAHSSTLFLTEEGVLMIFYMTPCAMKTKLRPIIEHGGGEISSKVLPNSIKLVFPGACGDFQGYISSDYIFDSVKKNRLQDMEKYRLKSSAAVTSNGIENHVQTRAHTLKIACQTSKKYGRQAYTLEEDSALKKFVKEHRHMSFKGNSLYKAAEAAQVTSHSWQSMRDHYVKILRLGKKSGGRKRVKALKFKTASTVADHTTEDEVANHTNDDARLSSEDSSSEDCEKQFEENLLRLAQESSKKISKNTKPDGKCSAGEDEISSSQDSAPTRRKRRKQKIDSQDNLTEFDGEVSLKEDPPSAKKKKEDLTSEQPTVDSIDKDKKEERIVLGIQKLCRIEELRAKYNLTVPQIIHSLVVNSGHLQDTEKYIKDGPGKHTWTVEEDETLLSEDKKAISALQKRWGQQAVSDRIKFMEGIVITRS